MFSLHPLLARDTITLGQFELCQLQLMNDANYPWFVLVPQVENIREIFQLTEPDQARLLAESTALSKAIYKAFEAEKLNVAALGNVCPQLHIHHIARYSTDPAWPAPVWGKLEMKPYTDSEKQILTAKLFPELESIRSWRPEPGFC